MALWPMNVLYNIMAYMCKLVQAETTPANASLYKYPHTPHTMAAALSAFF